MLSVLIPTYNYNTFFLAEEIQRQLILEKINFEIICFDDGSKSELNTENEKINLLKNSRFKSLKQNIGRSAIRNLLAKEAQYKWLLFLDADTFPVKSDFIKNNIALFNYNKTIFCGGLSYQKKEENLDLLRYKYGKKYEEISLKKRSENPEKYFFTSNFLIEKTVFNSVVFEEKLTQYGREDLLFSLNLINKGYNIEHFDNQVYHLGLDENSIFVAKTKNAMENLIFLENEKLIDVRKTPLLKFINTLSCLKLTKITAKLYPFFEKLTIKRSSLFFLNSLKISYLCHLKFNTQYKERQKK